MGCSRWQQLRLLLWKNYLLQKRQIIVTFFEIAIPTVLAIVLILIRILVDNEYIENATIYEPYSIEQLPSNLTSPTLEPWILAYSPDHNGVQQVMQQVETQLQVKVKGFSGESSLLTFLTNESNLQSALGGVVFTNLFPIGNTFPTDIKYKIRLKSSPRNSPHSGSSANPFSSDTKWQTQSNLPLLQGLGPRESTYSWGGSPGYMREGFLPLQHAINKAIIQLLSNVTAKSLKVLMDRYPYPPYNDDKFVTVIQLQLPVVLMLSFVFCVLNFTRDVVHEKEQKLKESMKIMGLDNWLHWTAWFMKCLFFLTMTIILMTIFFVIPVGKHGSIIGKSDPTVIFVFLFVYAIATISFCFMVSVFFSKANTAAASCGPIWFLLFIPYFFIQPRYEMLSLPQKLGCCLMLNTGMSLGAQVIGMFEGKGSGVQWETIAEPVSVDDTFTLLHVILMLLFDAVLYGAITWYVEAIYPGEFGVPLPGYFLFLPSYWCGTARKLELDEEAEALLGDYKSIGGMFERDPVGLYPGIQMQHLRKEFGMKVAVAGVNINAYQGQITVLLGHNGAGKTTTMSMLTGLFPPTSGTAIVNGYDIRHDISNVRGSLGLCLQHDVLFDNLTVEEHLIFFSKLKGCSGDEVKAEVTRMIELLGLDDKTVALSKTLSGGMKRKVSVGNALVGKAKIVILDEPTSGMDPVARRSTWDLLQRERSSRTILLSTHFMDEADLLGDRIAIMADGELQCCGSSLFLKKKYGAGYHMTIVKDTQCDVSRLSMLIHSYIPMAEMESNFGAELSFVLPSESVNQFPGLFEQLDTQAKELGVNGYGTSVTTMEEVFLRVGEGSDMSLKSRFSQEYGSMANTVANMNGFPNGIDSVGISKGEVVLKLNKGPKLYAQQFLAMFMKRIMYSYRSWLVIIAQLLIPCLFTTITLIVVKTLPKPTDSPPLILNLKPFGENIVPYYMSHTNVFHENLRRNSKSVASDLAVEYAHQFEHSKTRAINITNLPEYHDKTLDEFIIKETEKDLGKFLSACIVAAMFGVVSNETILTAYFNNQPYHGPGISLAAADNSLLKYFVNDSYNIETTNHPLPRTAQDQITDALVHDAEGFSISFNLMFGMAFLSSSFVLFLVKERSTKAKHIQIISGVYPFNFWLSTFVWDFINFTIPLVCILAIFVAFNIPAYTQDGHLGYVTLLLLGYGWSMLPFVYLWSFFFNISSTAFARLTKFNIISGIVTVLAVAILALPQLDLEYVSDALEWVFIVLLPNFSLGQGIQDLYNNYQFNSICEQPYVRLICEFTNMTMACCPGHCGDFCIKYTSNYLAWDKPGIGRMLVFMAVQGTLLFIFVFCAEWRLLRRLVYAAKAKNVGIINAEPLQAPEDDDVLAERIRINNTPIVTLFNTDVLILKELSKCYESLLAVDGLNFGVRRGECFGLLGMNGAGKTSTFKMLSGDESITSGDAFVTSYSVKRDIKKVQQRIGYCPQFDALVDHMTGRETLYMYARLRGVPERCLRDVTSKLMSALLLDPHADKLVVQYSGGTKRKLSTAVSLVGDPPVIFLDEPTTGMDPVARRLLWDALSRYRAAGKCIILTSHSMEECEALCTRIAIMVNGRLKCLGSPQHLKNKFGQGYTLLAKVTMASSNIVPDPQPFIDHVMSMYKDKCVLKDIHQGFVHLHIMDPSLRLSSIFTMMEKSKILFNLEDYSISQTTLEQVFLNFAKSQRSEDEIIS